MPQEEQTWQEKRNKENKSARGGRGAAPTALRRQRRLQPSHAGVKRRESPQQRGSGPAPLPTRPRYRPRYRYRGPVTVTCRRRPAATAGPGPPPSLQPSLATPSSQQHRPLLAPRRQGGKLRMRPIGYFPRAAAGDDGTCSPGEGRALRVVTMATGSGFGLVPPPGRVPLGRGGFSRGGALSQHGVRLPAAPNVE